MGTMVWPLFGALVFSWVCTYFAIWKGVKVTGKIMYFTGTSRAKQLALIDDLCHHHQQPVTSFPFAILGICEIAAILSQTPTNPDESDRRS